jgi:hypothetical protein
MFFLISSQMELLFASSLLKLVRMGEKMSGPQDDLQFHSRNAKVRVA